MKTFDRLVSGPVSLHAVVLGESLSGFLNSIGIAFVPFLAGLLIFGTPLLDVFPLILGMILTAFCFATMGTLFAAYRGSTHFNPLTDIAMLCTFILLFQIIANRLYKKFNE